jgi:hypothetical protein
MNNNVNPSLKVLDFNYIFAGIEHLAAILLVIIVAKVLLNKPNLFPKNLKNLVWVLVILWSVAVAVEYGTSLYNYYHATRPFYVQAQHNTTGL